MTRVSLWFRTRPKKSQKTDGHYWQRLAFVAAVRREGCRGRQTVTLDCLKGGLPRPPDSCTLDCEGRAELCKRELREDCRGRTEL